MIRAKSSNAGNFRLGAKPRANKFDQAWPRLNPARSQFQENPKFVIEIQKPKLKSPGILPGQTASETRGRTDGKIVQNNYGTDRRVAEREKKSMLALRRVRRTVDQDESRLFEPVKCFRHRLEVERFDESKPVPTALKRNHRRIIGGAPGDRSS